ncbi:glutamate receptor-interacting protein 1 isoform X1 [Harmonia axyridis]|uniref:glutamate receptor-interacting protein 1 isoform X1 n=1 Tax=Harmonia axyridis TaxID=115357 RepID=UPI001E279756|nr:glutamate receptor-interacting protein 1 isoform X1 [Harmonia axyridis]XP_045473896.1 glutamate receptor-interacting protein 1 isoform X1 [Harmonia axyridis]
MKLWKVLARNSHVYTNQPGIRNQSQMEMYDYKSVCSTSISEDSGKHSDGFYSDYQRQHLTTTVQLKRNPGESLGIIIGNSDLGSTPSIASLRPGSVAVASDQLVPGDKIHSINGINTSKMRAADVNSLLENVDDNAMLEIGYSLPCYGSQQSMSVITKTTEVTLERSDGSIGITLRGGTVLDHPNLSRPLIITHVRPNGPAARTGLIRVGDRVLKVDNQSLFNKTLGEAQQLLRESCVSKNQHGITVTTLTIEYEVSNMETVKYATGPLLVEIDRTQDEDFGVILNNYGSDFGLDEVITSGFFVGHIVQASTADRCGALNIGDQILAINDLAMKDFEGSLMDAEKLLRKARRLQILPFQAVHRVSRNYGFGQYPSPSLSGYSTINSRCSRRRNIPNRQSMLHKSFEGDLGTNSIGYSTNMGVCHTESLSINLYSDRGTGFGIGVSVGDHTDNKPADILISRIVMDSPAYRCGCLQVGDRITAVNHQYNLTLQEITAILDRGIDMNNVCQVALQVEFDVADTIVPSSGVFTVKLAKRGPGLGITITASKVAPDDPFIISEICRGSIAHRTGTLHAGDRLLAIDNQTLTHHTVESAFDIIKHSSSDIVTLKIEKTETEGDNLFLDSVVYTVELHRYGGPLGITISGSENNSDPIILSRITEGGLAEKTGALHVGDRILAINKESLEHRRLSDAIRLLQTSGDRVQLKIARNLKPKEFRTDFKIDYSLDSRETSSLIESQLDERCEYSSPDGVMSVDSAVHSWDSNNPDNTTDIKDGESLISEPISIPFPEKDSAASIDHKHDSQIQFYSDADEVFCPSPLPLPSYNYSHTYKYDTGHSYQQSNNYMKMYGDDSLVGHEVFHVTLYKDSIYDDYGFSVSDGLYEKGVYVNKIRKDGPADIVGLLKPYDRIIQVNDTKTQDFDCCLTVPLIASAGDRIELVIARNPYINCCERGDQDNFQKKVFPGSQHTITKTL